MTTNLDQLRKKRLNWVDANRENGFDEGINRLLTDLYPDNAHFIYELLQNAEDPKSSSVRFTLTDSAVKFEHNGERLFTDKDVGSITSIGNSTKRDDATSIGKFGVGFKAVFAYTNTPEIHSGDFHFRIHDLVVPENCEALKSANTEKHTHFIFPFNNPKKIAEKAVNEIETGLRNLGDNSLLFLSHIREIEYSLPDGSIGSLQRIDHENGRIEIRTKHPDGNEKVSYWLHFDKEVEVIDDDGNIKTCTVAIAYSLINDIDRKTAEVTWKIIPLPHGQVSIYFPAEKENSNLRFHLHAPFASTVARDSVRNCRENNLLRDCISDLVVESLSAIRDQDLLTVSFLAVLPNPADNLDGNAPFYEPIRVAIVDAFRNEELTPTRSGTYAPARELYRGPARIVEVINDNDLSLLINDEPTFWAANPPPQSHREDSFLDSLGINYWGWDDLANVMIKPKPNERVIFADSKNTKYHQNYLDYLKIENERKQSSAHLENWITKKEDGWLLRFYALLGEACDTHGEDINVNHLKIIRIETEQGNEHVTPNQAFFYPTDETVKPKEIRFVKSAVYNAGRSDNQKKFATSFLTRVGVQPFDTRVAIELKLKEYDSEKFNPTSSAHLIDIRCFVKYWADNPHESAESVKVFWKHKFLNVFTTNLKFNLSLNRRAPLGLDTDTAKEKHKLRALAENLYLDSPYEETGLHGLFTDVHITLEKSKERLSDEYHEIEHFSKFVKAIGVMTSLEICEGEATELQQSIFKKIGRHSHKTIDKDYFINGFKYANIDSIHYIGLLNIKLRSKSLSKAIWITMCKASPDVLIARYNPNQQYNGPAILNKSFLVNFLKQNHWIPNTSEKLLDPPQSSQELLHRDFNYDDRNGWLTAIGFGTYVKKQSEEHQTRNKEAQTRGFSSADELEEYAKLKKEGITAAYIRSLLPQKKSTELPVKSVPNPERRRKGVLERLGNAPSKESVMRERSIQPGAKLDTLEAKAYLRAQYENSERQLICQCCQTEMPFKVGEEHYFEAVQCVPKLDNHFFENRLALCPTCAAMYKYARDTSDAEIRRRIVENTAGDDVLSVEIPIRLAGRELTLWFVGTHWFDLKVTLNHIHVPDN